MPSQVLKYFLDKGIELNARVQDAQIVSATDEFFLNKKRDLSIKLEERYEQARV